MFLVQVLRTRRANAVNYSLKSGKFKTQMSQCFSLTLNTRRDTCPSSNPSDRKSSLLGFLFYSGLQLIGWSPATSWKAIYFFQSTDSNVNLIHKNLHRHTFRIVFGQMSGNPNGSVKLTCKIYYLIGLLHSTHEFRLSFSIPPPHLHIYKITLFVIKWKVFLLGFYIRKSCY